ncbi:MULTISPECIES: TadE/TadG family type IV pilus assembly protein [unclassified Rhizobium]|nr:MULTISPECIES: TadE/TadG family type IV pilus assembly protein [unclassified Rhizobium]KQS88061.1 pilus assembly protein [Rhizobium sp. Leaf386]KQS94705.1 pilus assembly protein [Rhizobium sp. Leaf391]KQU01756.1 pilus assembly protein [Rhizobium sp. Leaf453]
MAVLSDKTEAFRRFWRDRKGTGAIEFAIIAPLLIMAYIGSFEVSLGFSISRKVARASSTVADVLTQQTDVSKATLDGMKDVAKSVMAPYEMNTYTLKMTGITVTAAGVGTVAWSRDQAGGTPYKAGSVVTLPSDISAVNAFVVRSELVVPHHLLLFAPGLADNTLKTINLSKTYYFRQRVGDKITCSDC